MLKCGVCSATVSDTGEHQLCAELPHLRCPECHRIGVLSWFPPQPAGLTRKINATFDYFCQVYRTDTGDVANDQPDWDFPCPKCTGPSRMTGYSCYAEHHECLECGFKFDVK